MKVKLFTTTPAASLESRWRSQRESGKLRRAIERQFRQDYDKWEER